MKRFSLKAPTGESAIDVGECVGMLSSVCGGARPTLLVDAEVLRLHRERLQGYDCIAIVPGEESKTLSTVERLYQALLDRGLDRSSWIVGVGGGATCDVAGFIAATFLRGVHYGSVATTLLAQVDASIGGKNGINFGGYKNLVGTIRQPEFCLCDTTLLQTLPPRELSCGFAEVIKHAAIADFALFEFLEARAKDGLALVPEVVERAVFDSVQIKGRIVEADESEQGERKKLNFGHTIGHAIEVVHDLPHGEAISIGMVLAAKLSERRGLLGGKDVERLTRLLQSYRLPVALSLDVAAVFEALTHDKKRSGNSIKMILLERLGCARIEEIALTDIKEALHVLR